MTWTIIKDWKEVTRAYHEERDRLAAEMLNRAFSDYPDTISNTMIYTHPEVKHLVKKAAESS